MFHGTVPHTTPARAYRRWWLLVLAWAWCFCTSVWADNIETVIAPGKLIQGHAKWEEECKQCHVKFDRKAQDGLCMSCHKDVGADVRGKQGYHGRLDEPVCKSCHTEHKGRQARIATFDPKKFDHSKTDYALAHKHEAVACEKCHKPAAKYREAPSSCNACHKKDDVHKGSLGTQCADCHTEKGWKDAKFDHDTTDFKLTGKHSDVKCADCHRDTNYKETPKNCYACHRKVDDQKGHKGQFGEKCESCHSTKQWKPSTFRHDIDTKYVLRDKHKAAACKDCHTGNLYKEKLTQECYACHKKDDKHKETLGKKCESCHTEKSWKESPKFNHTQTDFPLLGKHAKVECKDCHKSALFKEAPKDCYSCHEKDDKHKLTLGKDCSQCHGETSWKDTAGKFDHARTKFPLRNAHAAPGMKCTACHKDLQSLRDTPLRCIACHKKDDKHQAQLGDKCDSCHGDKSWKDSHFDHSTARFALTGRHLVTECRKCHETQRYRDAARDCASCHAKDDRHKKKLGSACESCHNTRAWATASFDHDTKTKFRLEGAHTKPACEDCHKLPAPAGKATAPLSTICNACHKADDPHNGVYGPRCDTCHRVDSWKKLKNRVGAEAASPRKSDTQATPGSTP